MAPHVRALAGAAPIEASFCLLVCLFVCLFVCVFEDEAKSIACKRCPANTRRFVGKGKGSESTSCRCDKGFWRHDGQYVLSRPHLRRDWAHPCHICELYLRQ